MNVKQLKDQIYDANHPPQQYKAAYKMRFVKNNPEIIQILFKACYEARDPKLQQEAVRSLSVLKPDEALNVFTEKSRHTNDSIRLKSFYHLGTLGSPKGINAVLQGLLDPHPGIRKAAAISAGRIGDNYQAINALNQLVNPFESPIVQKEAEKSIAHIKKKIHQQPTKHARSHRSFNKVSNDYQSYTPIAF